MAISSEQAARFDAALWDALNAADEGTRAQGERAVLDLLPALTQRQDVARLLRLLRPPFAGAAAEALRQVGQPAVAGLLAVAADRGDPARLQAARSLADMNSWEAIPGLNEAKTQTRGAREQRLLRAFLRYHEKTAARASDAVARDYRKLGLLSLVGGCCLPWALVPVLLAALVVLAFVLA